MKKRILSILLTLCMMLCLTPISVFAEEVGTEGSAAIQLGADALSVLSKNVNTATAPTVYFGQNHDNNPAAWRVIGYDGSGVASSHGDITMLAAGAMGVIPFVDTILYNEYAPSNLKTAIDALAAKLTTEENAVVKKRTLTSGSYNGENTDCVAGGQVDNAVFWPLSAKEAIAVNNDLRALEPAHPNWVTSGWWLRSPGSKTFYVAIVSSDGSVQYSGASVRKQNNHRTVRPAFNLNLNSVLFASAAVGGKPDGGLTEVSEYSGNEWKLTLLDSSRNFAVTKKAVSAAPDDTVTLNYSGATTGKNEYISVILADNNGAQYYGRVAQPTAESGTVEIKIPSDIAPGDYTMKVFSEQYNGDCKTDLASAFADVTLTVESQPDEQFTLTPGGRYYFDLSAMNISGTVNSNLPDSTLHYVPFTYAGTVNAYKLTSEMATTEEYAQKNKYPHSLFIADYAVTHTVSWDALNTADLIFGKNYASGGVDYTLRTPSAGSDCTGLDDSQRGVPKSNEWDTMLNKNSGYIKNWNGIYSWGEDTTRYNSSLRAVRGYDSGRRWNDDDATDSLPLVGFRPVLEVLNPDTLSSDGLKVVTLDLGGGTLGGSSEDIQIIVKSSESFAAPASDGMTRPDGNTGSYFMWLGSNGKLYAPGASVPADVTKLTAQFVLSEQFSLTPGGRYYFDLSAMDIPGTVNSNLPDSTLHYVPFTYVGTVNAYRLTSEMATTEEYAQKNKYPHSLFIADYVVTNDVSWDTLNTADLIFGKNYAGGGVGYTLRAPSVGSSYTGSDDSERGTPKSNEWDKILDKDDGYIKNWREMLSCGQDTTIRISASFRAVRGWHRSARFWTSYNTSYSTFGFRPVLEVLNPDTLGSDGLKVVTLDLNGGTLGGSSDAIHIIVKTGSTFTAPASDGMTRPDGDAGSFFMWLGSNGKLYAPGASVPADVTKLTAQFVLSEQFSLTPGGRYHFDLSAMDIPGTVNSNLPDSTLHYVPFTYVGTVNAYSLKNEADNDTTSYEHSLFIADYNVKCSLQRETLAEMNLIYGQTYTASNVNYTLRAPSVGDHHRNEGEGSGLAPIDNEWDTIYQKSADYIKNWYKMRSFGQDIGTGNVEGMYLSRGGHFAAQATFWARPTLPERDAGFRPVLEVLNPDTLGADGMKVVTLDLNGGTLGGSSDAIQIIVKNGSTFTAPASDGLTRPDGDTDNYFMWLDGNGNSYEPGASVPADVTELTVQWTAPTYAVTLNTNGGTINNGNVTGYTYGVGATLPAADDMPYTGHTFKGWYDNENLTGSPVTAIGGAETGNKEYWAKWEINQYTITFDTNGGSEIAPITQDYGTEITAPDNPTRKGYTFKGWDKEIPETMPAENITITARWKDTEKPTGEIIIGTNKWNEFLNKLTFGIFFKDTQEVTINAVDNSGVVFVSYLVTDKELSEAELNSLVFRAYEEPFCIDPNGEYIVYVMLVDENINITYLRSDRITLDNIQPVISGIENGKTYCEAQTVIVDEKYVDTVTVNGTVVTLDADGGFVLPPTNGEQKIVVTDKAGNNAEMTVTVNNGHTFGEWVSDNDGKHTRKCTVDGCDAFETENCSGGNATCTEKAVCDVCGKAYGEFDGTNHEGGVQEWTTRTAFNHEQKWNCCGAVIVASEAHEWKDGVCRECGYVCLHNDADKDHVCDYCKKTISEHEDKDKDHICDYCKKTISAHEDATPEEIKKPDTVTAKPDDSKSPQTGDNSNLILWIALLIISGGVMKGVTAFGKSKKHSAKIKDK